MAEADPTEHPVAPAPDAPAPAITRGRLLLLFLVMLVPAAGNTAM